MGANDVIIIGSFRYTIMRREGSRILVSWVEGTGIYREMWIIYNGRTKIN